MAHWPWRVGLNPKAVRLWILPYLHPLCVCLTLSFPPLSEILLVERKCDPATAKPYIHTVLYHPPTSVPPESPPTTSGFQIPASHGPDAVSDRVWGTCHRAQRFQRSLIINMRIPTELSDIYSPVSGDMSLDSLKFNSVSGTACALRVVNPQQKKHTGAAAGVSFGQNK